MFAIAVPALWKAITVARRRAPLFLNVQVLIQSTNRLTRTLIYSSYNLIEHAFRLSLPDDGER